MWSPFEIFLFVTNLLFICTSIWFIVLWLDSGKDHQAEVKSHLNTVIKRDKSIAELNNSIAKLERRHTIEPDVQAHIRKNKNGRFYGVFCTGSGETSFTSSDLRATESSNIETDIRRISKTIPIHHEAP